jgi:hypothetical protein
MNVQPDMAFRLASAHTQQVQAQAARQRAGRVVKLDHRRGAPAGSARARPQPRQSEGPRNGAEID